jgi:hypothetical protein
MLNQVVLLESGCRDVPTHLNSLISLHLPSELPIDARAE